MGINGFDFFWLVSCEAHCWFFLRFAQNGSVNQGACLIKGTLCVSRGRPCVAVVSQLFEAMPVVSHR